jgi:hypothetical protein
VAQTGTYDLGSPIFTKYLRRIKLVGRGRFNLQILINFEDAVAVTKTIDMSSLQDVWNDGLWGAGTWGPDPNIKEDIIDLDLFARVFSIRLTDSDPNAGTQLFPVGSVDYALTVGEWAFTQATIDGSVLGLRG